LEVASASPLVLSNPSTLLNGSVQLTGAPVTLVGLKLGVTSSSLNNSNDVTVSGTFDGVNAASFVKSGLGKLTAVNGISYAGVSSTTVAAGELDLLGEGPTDRSTLTVNTSAVLGIGSIGAIPGGGLTVNTASTVNFINGIQAAKLTSLNGAGIINLTNNLVQPVEISIVQASGTSLASNFTGSFYGNGSLVIRSGTVFQLTSNNTYSGGTSIYSGTLAITSDSQLGNIDYATPGASARNLYISGGVLQANASFAIQRGRGVTIRGVGTIDVAASQNLTVQSVIANDGLLAGSLTKTGNGFLTLLAANTYSGDTLISGGELRITGDQSLGISSTGAYSNVKLAGGSLTLISPGVTALSSSRSMSLAAAVGGLNAFAGSVLSVGSSIAGSGQIVVNSGASALGEVQLLGVNSFTNGVKVVAGRLVINSDRSLGATGATSDINLAGGALVADPGANSSISLDPSRNVSISATGSAIEVVQDASLNIRGLLDRTGTASAYQLTKQGRGTLILEGNNGYNGSWLIADGTLKIGNLNQQGTLGSTASLVTNNARLSFNRLDDIDFANVVTGTGSVSQDGPGYVKFTGANKYSGSTIINSGSLRLGDATYQAAVSSYSTISIGSTASFWLANVKTETTPGVFTAYTANSFPNYVTGAGDLHVAYASGATLNFGKVGSANNYSGATYVDSGTLKPVTVDAISRSSAFHVGTGVGSTAALDLSALGSSYSLANDQVLSGSGTVKMAVGASLVIKGTLSPGGATPYEVGIGTLTIGQASVGAAPNVILQPPSSIQAQGFQMYMDIGSSNLADKLVVPGNISVAGKLILINNLNVGGQGSADTGTFDVVVATGTVSKGASPTGDLGFILDDSNLQGYRSSLTYTTNKVTLSLTKLIEGGGLGALAVAPTFDFGSVHVNAVARKNVPVKNTATGANPDTLDVSFAPPAPGLTATGSITGLATNAGTNTTDLWLQLQTSTPGLKSSNVQLIVTSVSPVSGQQPYTFAPALLNAVGKVYAYADPQVDATTLDLGSSHPNVAFVPKKITIQNNAPAGGYGESLQVQVGAGTSSNLNANGVILSLAAQATDSTSLSAAFKAQGTAGLVNGSFTLDYVSLNQPNSGLFPTALPSQTYNVVGRVYDYAVPDALSLPAAISLGSFHVNDVAMQAVTVANTASAVSGYSESLSATVTTTGSVRSSGSVDSLAPQATSNAIRVGVNTSAPGALSGKANISYTSVAFANSGLQDTPLTSLGKSINVSATVYDYAHPVVPTTIDVGSVHVGEAFSYRAVNVQNQLQPYAAANSNYVEKLDVTLPAGSTANVGTTGSVVGLAAGDSSGNSLMVTLNTATSSIGSTTGLLTLGFNSKAIVGSNLSDTVLSTKNITITGRVYALAQVSLAGGATPVLNLGSVHSGDSISAGFLAVGNSATASLYTETLKVAFDSVTATNNLKLTGMVTGLQAGNTDSGTMQVGFLPGSVGSQVGSVNLLFTSQALPGSGIVGDTSLGQATLTVRGTVYDYAKASVPTTTFVLPAVHVGGSFGVAPISVSNIATASANTEALNAYLVSPSAGVLIANGASGSITLAGQDTDNTTLGIGLDSSLATTKGLKTGSANLRLVSKVVAGAVGLTDTVLANQAVTISAAVYDYAAHNLPATNTINLGPVRGGVTYSVPELAVTNTGATGAYTEPLKVVFGNPSQELVTVGSIAGLASGAQDTTTMKVGFVSGLLGQQTGSFNLRATSVGQAGLADTQLPSAAYSVTGTVYQVASASRLPTAIYLGAFHVGDDALRNLTIENTASSQAYGEGLTVDANLAVKSSNARIYGNVSNLAPGATNTSSMLVGLDTALPGQITGTVSLTLTSIPKVVPLQPLSLGNASISVSADVYSYAIPAAANITLPSIHVGDPAGFVDGSISVRNNAPGGLYSESLKATILNTSSNLTARSSQVIVSANSNQGLTVNLATPTQGGQSYGTMTLGYTSLSVHTGVLGDTPLATQSVVEVRGNAYDYARGQVAMLSANLGNSLSLAPDGHIVFNIGDTRVGGTYADAFIPLKNSGPAGQYTETLRASLTTTSPDVSIFSGTVDIAPQEVNASTLKVGFTPLKAANAQLGPTSGNIRINLTSLADSGSGLRNTTLDPINVEVVGNAYQAAAPVLNKPIVRLGRPVYGPYMAVMDTNARYDSTGWIYSNADPVMSEGLTLRNNTPAGTWSESLGWTATLTGAAKLTDNGTLAGTLAPSDTRVLNLGLTPQAGVVTGTVHFDYISKAAANSTLQDVAIPVGAAADVTVRTVGYRAADWALPASTTVNRAMTDGSTQKVYRLNVGSVKTGQPFSTLDLIFSNTAPDTGGWTENLKVVVRNSTAKTVVGSAVPAGYSLAPITLNGGINALTWGRNSSAGDITATFAPGNSGNLAGYFGLDIYSSAIANPMVGGHGSSLGDYLLDSIIVELYGSVMDKATASVTSSIDFGATRVGVPFAWRGVEVSNTGISVSAASEMINATIDSVTMNGQARGSGVANLAATAGANSNTTGIQANLDVSAAGNRSGVLTVNLSSTDGTTATTLDSQTVNLYGKVYAPADPYLATTVNLGSFRMGSTTTKNITIGNQAAGGFAESLGVTVNSVSAGLASTTLNQVAVAPGSTGVVAVGLGAGVTEGAFTGSVRLDMQSLGAYGLAPMQLASSTVAVSATVYKPADPSLVPLTGLVNGAVDLGYKHQGATWDTKSVYVQNLATGTAGFVESLGATLGSFTGDAASSSAAVTIAPGATSTALLLTLSDKTAGQKSGTAKVLYNSLATAGSGLNDLALTSQNDTITVKGYMYSGQGVWTGGSGNWSDDPLTITHWTKEGGRPGMDGQLSIDSRDSATFSNGLAAVITVDTANTIELATLTFNSAAGTRLAKTGANVGFKLNGSVTSGRGLIDVKLGSNTIDTPISFDTTANDIKLADNTSLYLYGDLSSASSGSGLTVQGLGTGTLYASGRITVSNFTIDSGRVVFQGSDPLSADVSVIVNGGSLDLAGNGQTVANLMVKGGVVTASGASRAAPSVIRASTFSKDSTGNAWLGDKNNREAVVITGMSGVSQVNTGKLYNNAWFKGELLVASGATLGGNGRSGAVYNYGTIAPGNSIDTYNAGSTVFYTGSTLSIEANQGAADLLNVTGTVTINSGANVQVIAYVAAPATPTATTLTAGTRHTIVSATGAIAGQFSTVVFDAATAALLPSDLRPTLLYGNDGAGRNTIDLLIGTISGPSGGAIGGTPFADYLQRHNGLVPLNFPSLLALGSGTPALYDTLDHIDLTTLSSLPSAIGRSGSRFTKVVASDVFAELTASGTSFSGQGISKQNMLTAKDVLRAVDGVDTFTGTWTRGYSEVTSINQSDSRFDYDYTLAGVAAGIDLRRTQEETVGVAFGFSQFESKFSFDDGRTKGDGVDFGFYALHHSAAARMALGLSISRYSLSHQHNFTLAGLTKTAVGETSAQRMQLNFEGDRQLLAKDGWIYRGRAMADLELFRRNAFTESGAGELSLAVDGQRTTGLKLGLGVSAARTFARGDKNSGWTFVGELMAVQGWMSGDTHPTARLVSDQTGDRYQVNAPSAQGLQVMPSLRLEYRTNNTGMTVELADEIGRGGSSPGVNLKFDTRF
jgi:autotransporter-associated beta strand protein